MRLILMAIATISVLIGCAAPQEVFTSRNRERLMGLTVGMSRDEVLGVMGTKGFQDIGNPYRTEMYNADGHQYQLLLYYTEGYAWDRPFEDEQLTPVVIKDGVLDGWGWSYWYALAERYELRIR